MMAVIEISNSILGNGLRSDVAMRGTGPPVPNITGLGQLRAGDRYVDSANGGQYVVTATDGATTISFTGLLGATVS